ncbi:hypothetical protein [Nostoc parmelioides]|uniref:Glycosyltransferase RgtA/B/C/D-like domain-containing protein n=1 Tax=Nostoc parmelioides FACHB-3921 TaxID=2692909 RepID=A0ABR8BEJ7_9NOSO|nr:hypothetical protein [Nostoc parmelioides]MBD2252522.1 hypothetical protein [Nostoc parmelioides FACHB-3921]
MLQHISLKKLSHIMMFLSLIWGIYILSFVVINFSDYSGDQINDAYRIMAAWDGKWPTLGSGPTAWSGLVGEFYLPPLYYYLVFPFTALTADLSAQAMPNALLTFFSIPLIILTTYKLLENVEHDKRLFLSALAGFWYICLFQNIVMSTGNSIAGNPVSITFFLLCFVLLYTYQMEGKLSSKIEILSWIAYGVVLAIISNLHFSTLYVMPVVFIITIIFYLSINFRQKRRWMLSGVAALSAIIAMTPYWVGEIGRNWINTARIIAVATKSSGSEEYGTSLLSRFKAIFNGYFGLGQEVYFAGESWKSGLISLIFLSLILGLGIIKFRGNRILLNLLFLIWLVFLAAYSSTDMEKTYNPTFYKLLIYLAPIFFTVCSLAYLNFPKNINSFISVFIIACITISIIINLNLHFNYISSRSGIPRIISTRDVADSLRNLPEKSTLCHPNGNYRNLRNYEYIDRYITKRELSFIAECQTGFYIIHAKYKSLGNYKLKKNDNFPQGLAKYQEKSQIIVETPLYYVYRLSDS